MRQIKYLYSRPTRYIARQWTRTKASLFPEGGHYLFGCLDGESQPGGERSCVSGSRRLRSRGSLTRRDGDVNRVLAHGGRVSTPRETKLASGVTGQNGSRRPGESRMTCVVVCLPQPRPKLATGVVNWFLPMSGRACLCVCASADCIHGDVPSAQITSGIYPSLGMGELLQLFVHFLCRYARDSVRLGIRRNPVRVL